MQYKIEISEDQKEDIVILAKEHFPVIDKIEEILKYKKSELFGYSDGEIIKIDVSGVYCFFTEMGKVYAICDSGKWQLKERLYVLEENFSMEFVKINQSCLIKTDKIERFRTTIGGSLEVILKNGYTDYVSRRQLKAVKERLGI